jgi:coiled-coil and C2 domain-containing protein 2A
MYLGKTAWLLLGVGIPHGPTAYVLTRDEEQHNVSYWLWDPASGQKYSIQDSFCPLQKVFCLINDENVSICFFVPDSSEYVKYSWAANKGCSPPCY